MKPGIHRNGVEVGQRWGTAQDVPGPGESDVWTPEAVKELLMAAAGVIMAQPLGPRDIPMELKAAWPDPVHNAWEVGVLDDSPKVTRLKPSAAQVDLAETAIAWLMCIDNARDRRVVGARVFGVKWKAIARFDGRNAEYLRGEFWQRRLAVIAQHLQAEKKISPNDLANLARFG